MHSTRTNPTSDADLPQQFERDALPGDDPTSWLFRDALRHRQIHPLMEHVRRYREQQDHDAGRALEGA